MIGLKTVDSFSQEEAGQGYVDFHEVSVALGEL
jgi:hypothetical protein